MELRDKVWWWITNVFFVKRKSLPRADVRRWTDKAAATRFMGDCRIRIFVIFIVE
jgi:hypothetical protein